ncbi:hypothetical protein ACIA8O_14465 [Kitasatospora sp. NPDC051853]|uniref:hypothetical protein n=1 Tax=Kitasatospora sp. NPDC051853 TaxID=3364058 RepID=UPI0037AE82E1
MSWYVLVERNDSLGGDNTWVLSQKVAVDGGRDAAVARAEELCRTIGPREEYGRLVFRRSETSWLVELTREVRDGSRTWSHGSQLHVSVAELVHSEETPPAPQPKRPWRRG